MKINTEMLDLAKSLVNIPSINTTSGEKDISDFIENYLKTLPYFKAHPEYLIVQPLKNDALNRRNIFALLRGENSPSCDTILLHGHTDTVGTHDFGALEPYAFEPDILKEKLSAMDLPEGVREDLQSGDYMFGRGACDMKSGDAVFLEVFKTWTEKPELLSGNILVSFNPVEENLHTGIIEGLDVLLSLKEKYKLNYILAINNDFTCPLYEGDPDVTLYTGAVGKLLPCFYIQGKATHVGQCFEGFDASMVAADLVSKINLNTAFSDGYDGEYTYPPSVLKMKDLKPWYNVQTADSALVYFNYFVHNTSIESITNSLVTTAEDVLDNTINRINAHSSAFSKLSGQTFTPVNYDLLVLTYDALVSQAKATNEFDATKLEALLKQAVDEGIDQREIPVEMIKYLLKVSGIHTPCIVLYYAAPYCPHNTLQGDDEKHIHTIKTLADEITKTYGTSYRMMKFFPSLSDSSYLKIDDDDASTTMLLNNFPAYETLYPVPLHKIKALNIPAVNFGCYGKDAHKWTERVNISYTFGVLPHLLDKTIKYYLTGQ